MLGNYKKIAILNPNTTLQKHMGSWTINTIPLNLNFKPSSVFVVLKESAENQFYTLSSKYTGNKSNLYGYDGMEMIITSVDSTKIILEVYQYGSGAGNYTIKEVIAIE